MGFAGVYYDKGVTGTKTEGRDELLRLISDCENGLVDFIVTKSISRFFTEHAGLPGACPAAARYRGFRLF